ncbi:MAG: hypothetical protein WC506_06015 [Candidatus Micrarchaeia archaeon]
MARKSGMKKGKASPVALIAAMAFLALLATPAFASIIPDLGLTTDGLFSNLYAVVSGPGADLYSWVPLTSLTLATAILLIGLAYMAGSFLQNPKIIAWAKENLFQAGGSAVLIIGFFFLLTTVNGISHATFCSPSDPADCNHIYKAKEYATVVGKTLVANFISLNIFNIALSVYGTLQINIRPGGFGLSFSIAPMFRPIMDAMGLIMNFLTAAWAEWVAQTFLLDFIEKQMLAIFLPIGILLRSFPFTRSAGGALLALVFGLYFVYPVTLVANKAIADAHYGAYVDGSGNSCTFSFLVPCLYQLQVGGSITEFIHSSGIVAGSVGSIGLAGYLIGIKAYGLLALAAPLFAALVLGALAIMLKNFVMQLSYIILVLSLMLPIFNLFIVMTSIREMAKFLGSDLNISALLRLI